MRADIAVLDEDLPLRELLWFHGTGELLELVFVEILRQEVVF